MNSIMLLNISQKEMNFRVSHLINNFLLGRRTPQPASDHSRQRSLSNVLKACAISSPGFVFQKAFSGRYNPPFSNASVQQNFL